MQGQNSVEKDLRVRCSSFLNTGNFCEFLRMFRCFRLLKTIIHAFLSNFLELSSTCQTISYLHFHCVDLIEPDFLYGNHNLFGCLFPTNRRIHDE